MSRSQLISAVSNWLAFAATLAVALGLTPFLIARLGPARYDVWCVAEAILAWFTLLDMGLAACLVRGVARHHAIREETPLNRMASACLGLFAAAALIAILVGLPVILAVAPKLSRGVGNLGDATAFFVLMLVNVALTLPLSVFPSILDGLARYAAKSIVRVAFLLARTAAIVAVMHRDASLLPLAIAITASNLLEHATLAFLAYRFLPSLRFGIQLIDRQTLSQVRGYSVDAFLAMLAGRITVQTGIVLIKLLLPVGDVTVFATAARLVDYAKTLLRTLTATLTPGISSMEARGDWDGIRAVFLTATRWVLYIALPIQVGLILFGKPFLIRWVPAVGANAMPSLLILATTLSVAVAQSAASRLLYGLGRLRLFARLALGEAALNALLLAALIHSYGMLGVAVAIAIPNLLFCLAVIVYTMNVVHVKWREYLAAWLKPLISCVVPAMIWSLIETQPEWSSITTHIMIGLVPYGMIVLLLEANRHLALSRLRNARRILRLSSLPSH